MSYFFYNKTINNIDIIELSITGKNADIIHWSQNIDLHYIIEYVDELVEELQHASEQFDDMDNFDIQLADEQINLDTENGIIKFCKHDVYSSYLIDAGAFEYIHELHEYLLIGDPSSVGSCDISQGQEQCFLQEFYSKYEYIEQFDNICDCRNYINYSKI